MDEEIGLAVLEHKLKYAENCGSEGGLIVFEGEIGHFVEQGLDELFAHEKQVFVVGFVEGVMLGEGHEGEPFVFVRFFKDKTIYAVNFKKVQ